MQRNPLHLVSVSVTHGYGLISELDRVLSAQAGARTCTQQQKYQQIKIIPPFQKSYLGGSEPGDWLLSFADDRPDWAVQSPEFPGWDCLDQGEINPLLLRLDGRVLLLYMILLLLLLVLVLDGRVPARNRTNIMPAHHRKSFLLRYYLDPHGNHHR